MTLASPRCNNRVQKRNDDQKKCTLFFFHPNPKVSFPIKLTITLPVAGNLFNQPTPPLDRQTNPGDYWVELGQPQVLARLGLSREQGFFLSFFLFPFFFWERKPPVKKPPTWRRGIAEFTNCSKITTFLLAELLSQS